MHRHFILCGLGRVGWRVLEQLRAAGAGVVAIDTHCAPDDPRLRGATLIRGDCRQAESLRRAGLEHARGVVILTSEDLVSLSTAMLVRHLHPTIHVVVRLFNQALITRLGTAMGNMHALSTSALAAPLLALIARSGAAGAMIELNGDQRRQIAALTVSSDSGLVGQSLGDVAAQHDVALVGYQSAGRPICFLHDVDARASLAADDRLVVCGRPETVTALVNDGAGESLPELLWANFVKRLSRVFSHTVAQVDWPLKVCAAVFFAVVLVSVIVFHFGMKDDTVVDAFYRTISLLATGADMHGEEVERGSWQKAFISGLRLVGTALTAAFTAIFTNYLIRANLGGALEVRRIPESGHIIVCGLGNVGFRVVEELVRLGEPVVVIEGNPANPFISSARRLGAAVIVGDAAIAQVLHQAHAPTARAVVAATSNDLVNVEIALLVRELAARQRVVLRLTDSQLAGTLRQSANLRHAVSIPDLAAPAFVAALYGDHVRGMFQLDGRLLSVYDLVVQESEKHLLGIPVPELAAANRFLPLALLSGGGVQTSWTADRTLAAGERLTVIMSLEDLQQMLIREMNLQQADQSTTSKA